MARLARRWAAILTCIAVAGAVTSIGRAAPLDSSTFEATDGNLIVNAGGNRRWSIPWGFVDPVPGSRQDGVGAPRP